MLNPLVFRQTILQFKMRLILLMMSLLTQKMGVNFQAHRTQLKTRISQPLPKNSGTKLLRVAILVRTVRQVGTHVQFTKAGYRTFRISLLYTELILVHVELEQSAAAAQKVQTQAVAVIQSAQDQKVS
jgi:hypothetical protein